MTTVVGAIFARGGSKGVPRKNVRLLGGKPLIAWSIEAALAAGLERVVVSTDDEEIAEVARAHGAEVPFMRPPELATDEAPERLAMRHLISRLRAEGPLDVLISVPPTSPLRAPGDIAAVRDELLAHPEADTVITITPARRSPFFNMVRLEQGVARLAVDPPGNITRRQEAPQLYDVTTVAYAFRADALLSHDHLFDGTVRTVLVPEERALDIDTELDLQWAEFQHTRLHGAAALQPPGDDR